MEVEVVKMEINNITSWQNPVYMVFFVVISDTFGRTIIVFYVSLKRTKIV